MCIRYKEPVRARQEGIQCDGWDRWQHRTCDSGISQQQYRNAVRNGQEKDNAVKTGQNIQYTQNRFKEVNWTPKNYVHVVYVVI